MNSFLRAIGFSKYTTKKSMQSIVSDASLYPEYMDYINADTEGKIYEFNNHYGDSIGIKFYGTEADDFSYDIDYYTPYIEGNHYFYPQDLCIEKRYSGFNFIASCEDLRVGVSIIFHLLNPIDYVNFLYDEIENGTQQQYTVAFSALSFNGTILLPISQSPGDQEKKKDSINRRASLIAAARRGDEAAIESLTFEDMDTYAKISKRIRNEDIFTIVESSFMPYGLESDLYTIITDIESVKLTKNSLTGESVYIMTLNYNGIKIDTAINAADLIGEPVAGRRFKGTIWLQGKIKFIK